MTMNNIFRNAMSKVLFPTMERDLSQALSKELAKAHHMTDCMLAPSVYAFERRIVGGMAAPTAQRHARFVKKEYPVPGRGLFQ